MRIETHGAANREVVAYEYLRHKVVLHNIDNYAQKMLPYVV